MSLLLSEGHRDAEHYPVAVVWSEARIVRQREAIRAVNEAVVLQATVASLFAKKGDKSFEKLLKKMQDGD